MTFSDIGETYKSAGIVVTDRLGVPKGLQQWVGLQDNVLDVLSQQTDQRLGRCKHLPQVGKRTFPKDLVSECRKVKGVESTYPGVSGGFFPL